MAQQITLLIFNGEHYEFWNKEMKTLLASLGLWELVKDGYVEPEDETNLIVAQMLELRKTKQKDATELSKIQQAVADSIFPRIMKAEKAKEAWEILQMEFGGDDKEEEMRKGELEADKDKMMREYRAQLDAERARKLAHGKSHSSSKFRRKKDRDRDSKKHGSKKRKHSRRSSDSSSSSLSETSSSDDDEDEKESKRPKSRSRKRRKKEKKHRSKSKHSSSENEEADGPLPLSRFFGSPKN